jgi:transposase
MEKCEWYKPKVKKLSDKLYFPKADNKSSKWNCNSAFFENFDYKHKFDAKFKKLKTIDYNKKIEKIKESLKETIKKINSKGLDDVKRKSKIKSCKTKSQKKIDNINKMIKTRKYGIKLCDFNKEILLNWMNECNKLYNHCVDMFNSEEKMSLEYTNIKVGIFEKLYGSNKPVPYDVLTDVIKVFCSNAKSCFTNYRNGNIKHFTMKKRSRCKCICIPKKSINSNGFFTTKLNKIDNFDKMIDVVNIKSDTKLVYDYDEDKFYLFVPQYFDITELNHPNEIVALDPGEKIFMSYYSLKNYGFIGNDIRKPILKIEKRIRRYQRGLSNKVNKNKKKLKNRKSLKLKIRICYKKIRNMVKELHNQTALYLCKNYKRIIIPPFETKKMVKNEKRKKVKEALDEIKKEKKRELLKENLKKFRRKSRLNGRVKFVLLQLSHYKFRQHLLHKCKEYGCHLAVKTEEYTSKCCGNCGILGDKYTNRIKTCENCNSQIHRDINGARNILLKNSKTFMIN